MSRQNKDLKLKGASASLKKFISSSIAYGASEAVIFIAFLRIKAVAHTLHNAATNSTKSQNQS